MKILIIEDSKTQAALFKKIVLALGGIDPVVVNDAFEGFSVLKIMPDIRMIILDNRLPYVDGIEFLKKIRTMKQFSEVKVIISSVEDLTDEYLSAGADKILIKPFEVGELNDYIVANC